MNITLNGQAKDIQENSSLQATIESVLENSKNVIAELNGQIVQKDQWDTTTLNEGDSLELVAFVGGG